MAKTDYKTIGEYRNAFTDDILERMRSVRELVHKVAPNAEEVISYQIPAFKIGKKFLIYYSAFTNHLTLSHPWSEALLNEFAAELKGMKVSKSAIQVPHNRPLPLDFIERLLKFRKNEVEGT